MASTKRRPTPRQVSFRVAMRRDWAGRAQRSVTVPTLADNQILRGLVFAVPLALAIWLVLAFVVWAIV